MGMEIMPRTEQSLPSVCTGGRTLRNHRLKCRLETLHASATLNHRSRKEIIYIDSAKEAPPCNLLLPPVHYATQLQTVGMHASSSAPVRKVGKLYVLPKVRWTEPKDAPMNYAEDRYVPACAEWGQIEMEKGISFRQPELMQKAPLETVNTIEVAVGSMINPWSPILNERQDMGFPQLHHLANLVEASRPKECHSLPAARMHELINSTLHRELRVEDDAQQLAIVTGGHVLANDMR